ncbi:hypothetical protein CARUB_v10026969mg [Capsella rubella]|uniref:Leucine-rich repeat-containing N-terminal plant-type domain-containing protein n=1 Tax=Capsella rubella TaxID=81985 RepID=R0EY74_9BRAS|nr:hypothetical protein CARUB_v10026969mg [Capsella rubella]
MVCRVFATFIWNCSCLLLLTTVIDANQGDVECLRTFKSQVEDPNGFLWSWDFTNQTSQGFICKFTGVTCWHDHENRVLSINLYNYGLRGVFPLAVKNCSDLVGLDLAKNNFSGPLPPNLVSMIPLVTSLDLSYNSFSGEIPASVSNVTFMNSLMLQHNQFTGQIPPDLAKLARLKTFSVANNLLEGPIPTFKRSLKIGVESFANNSDLCGKPLDDCKVTSFTHARVKIIIISALCGFTVAVFVIGIVLGFTVSIERLLFRKGR